MFKSKLNSLAFFSAKVVLTEELSSINRKIIFLSVPPSGVKIRPSHLEKNVKLKNEHYRVSFIFRRIERISGLFVCIGYNVHLCLSTSEITVLERSVWHFKDLFTGISFTLNSSPLLLLFSSLQLASGNMFFRCSQALQKYSRMCAYKCLKVPHSMQFIEWVLLTSCSYANVLCSHLILQE